MLKFLSYHGFCLIFIVGILQGCGIYSFSGSSLSSEAKTFSIQSFSSDVAKGPPDMVQKFIDKLRDQLLQKTSLTQIKNNGDVQFEGRIIDFKYSPLAPQSGKNQIDPAGITRLTISVEMDYTNPFNAEFEFSRKIFYQYADMSGTASIDAEEPRLVQEIFDKLLKDILNASVNNW